MNEKFTKHFKNPKGILGTLAGKIMAHENTELYEWTMEHLDVQEKDRVLEIGYGPGEGLHMLLSKYPTIKVDGIDPSDVMKKEAFNRNEKFINNNRLRLLEGKTEEIPYESHTYDKIVSVNNYPLWEDRLSTLQHIQSLLKIDGKLVITLQPRQEEATREQAFAYADEVQHLLLEAGFSDIQVYFKHLKPSLTICLTALNK